MTPEERRMNIRLRTTPFGWWLWTCWEALGQRIPVLWFPYSGGAELLYRNRPVLRIWPASMRKYRYWPFKSRWGNPI